MPLNFIAFAFIIILMHMKTALAILIAVLTIIAGILGVIVSIM